MIYAAPATAETLHATELTSRKDSIMELRHLRYFVAVAEELHFARAAERLHIEQSPLSRAIRELETDLGVQLFEREPRGTHLTWAGEVFLEDVRRVFTASRRGDASAPLCSGHSIHPQRAEYSACGLMEVLVRDRLHGGATLQFIPRL
jgi:regulatory helix-turn-helix LysR family protein